MIKPVYIDVTESAAEISLGFEAGISIVFLAIIMDRLTGGIANRLQKHRRGAA